MPGIGQDYRPSSRCRCGARWRASWWTVRRECRRSGEGRKAPRAGTFSWLDSSKTLVFAAFLFRVTQNAIAGRSVLPDDCAGADDGLNSREVGEIVGGV